MEQTKKRAKVWLCIAIALMLLSMVVVSTVQTAGGKVTIKDLRWETTVGVQMSGLLFVPEGVSAEHPVPAIVVSHGMFNNREMQDANFVELSRRGFVVLSMDMFSHGYSENVSEVGTVLTGMYEAVKMLSTLSYVDTSRIGITGHSLGGMSSNAAIAQDNAADVQLISAVLLNSADATYNDPTTQEFVNIYGNRDAGMISCQYDEFFHSFADANGAMSAPRDFLKSVYAQSFLDFGVDPTGKDARTSGTVYHETIDGVDAMRVIYNPAIIHPWSHFSKQSTTATINFFSEAFGAPNPIDANNQVWQWKEAFNLIGLIGFVMFIVNFTILMVFTPFFSGLRAKAPVEPRPFAPRGKLWFWGTICLGAVFATLVYLPIMLNVGSHTFAKGVAAQSSPWGISIWAAACGVFGILTMFLSYVLYGKKNQVSLADNGVKIDLQKLGKTVLLAVIVVSVSYSCVFFADYFFKTDFRIWFLAIKAFDASKIFISLFPYMPLFLVYYVVQSVAANSFNYNTLGKKKWVNTAVIAFVNAFPAILLVAIQYINFFVTGHMMWPNANMHVLWLIGVMVILAVTTVISRKIYRATNNPYLAGIINAVIVTLMSCSNTLTWK